MQYLYKFRLVQAKSAQPKMAIVASRKNILYGRVARVQDLLQNATIGFFEEDW